MSLEKALEDFRAKPKNSSDKESAFAPYQTCHFFSNQGGIEKIYADLQKAPPQKVAKKNNVAIIIGESSFISLAPVLAGHIDTVLMLDIDPRVLRHNLFMIECLKKSNHPEPFCQLLCGEKSENPLFKLNIKMDSVKVQTPDGKITNQPAMLLNQELYKLALKFHVGLAGQSHFLHSEENFWRAKQAVAKLTFHSLQVDFFDMELIELLGRTLFDNNAHISLINVSNLYDYDGPSALRAVTIGKKLFSSNSKVYTALDNLLYRPEETYILYGMMDPNKKYESLTSRLCIGVSQYQLETSAYSAALNAAQIIERRTKKQVHLFPETSLIRFFDKKLPTVACESTLIDQLRVFLNKHVPNATFQAVRSPGKYLIDAVISVNLYDGIYLLMLLKKYNFPYKFEVIDDKFTVTILEVNVKSCEITKMLEDPNIRLRSKRTP